MRALNDVISGTTEVKSLILTLDMRSSMNALLLVVSSRTEKPVLIQAWELNCFDSRDFCNAAICALSSVKACHRFSLTMPASRPLAVSLRSALSARLLIRYSLRDVNMRYGSLTPLVIR